ncbi:hypothetical protein N9W20_01540 [Candidatus Pelagibacter bacterium]|nr:hypothetical protein [Candidatus Pelagibacter bacterium]
MGIFNSYTNIVNKRNSLVEEMRKTNESIKQAESELEDICDIEDSDDRHDEEVQLNQIVTRRNIDFEELKSKLNHHDECVKYVEQILNDDGGSNA